MDVCILFILFSAATAMQNDVALNQKNVHKTADLLCILYRFGLY